MKKFLTLFALVLLAACQSPLRPETPVVPNTPPTQADEDNDEDEAPAYVATSIDFALVAMGDGTMVTGPQFIGCGDQIQMVESSYVDAGATTETVIQAALEALFQIEGSSYGESGLYNALYQSDLNVESVSVSDDESSVIVALTGSIASGGTCDDPRIEAQIRETIKAHSPEDSEITVLIDGEDLNEYFDMSGL